MKEGVEDNYEGGDYTEGGQEMNNNDIEIYPKSFIENTVIQRIYYDELY